VFRLLLKDKTVLITGASKGIGKATSLLFAKEGAHLILNGRDEEALLKLQSEIEYMYGTKPIVMTYDVGDLTQIKKAFQLIKKECNSIDVLINNAGILNDALLGMVGERQMSETFSINLSAIIYHMQYASRLMTRQKSGSIINVSSIIGRFGNVGQTVYGASKAGVIGATMSAAKELAPYNIRVNAVAPGFIKTDMVKQLPEEKYEERMASIKMMRIGEPEEVANVLLFLASDMSSYVTGQVIGVDGGMII